MASSFGATINVAATRGIGEGKGGRKGKLMPGKMVLVAPYKYYSEKCDV